MTRRRFLQHVAMASAYLAGGKTLSRVVVEAAPGGGISIAPVGAAAAGTMIDAGAQVSTMPMTAAYILWRKLEAAETARRRWYHLWRLHRIKVRRHIENLQPAKMVWLRDKLKELRRTEQQRRMGLAETMAGRGQRPTVSRAWRREDVRIRKMLRIAGLKHPWDRT